MSFIANMIAKCRPWLQPQHLAGALPKLAVAIGIVLRLKNYFEARSLWVDESWASIEAANRSFAEIFQHDYIFDVSSRPPTLFLLIQKINTILFGNNELALRIFPLFCGLVSLGLFYRIAKRYLSSRGFCVAMWLFALADPLVYYSGEAKRYATTLCSALLLWYLAPLFFERPFDRRKALFLGVLGGGILWLSNVSVFVLAAILIFLNLRFFIQKRYREMAYLFGSEVLIGASGLLIYHLSLKDVINHPAMIGLWQAGLWQGNAFSFEAVRWALKAFYESITAPCGLGFPALAVLLMVIGAVAFSFQNLGSAALYAFPVYLTLTAAVWGRYPFEGRVILFLVPAYYLFLAHGIDFVSRRFKRSGIWLFIGLSGAFMLKPAADTLHFLAHNRPETGNREVLEFFNEHYRAGDAVYLNVDSKYAFWYYAGSLGYGKKFSSGMLTKKDGKPMKGTLVGYFDMGPVLYEGQKILMLHYKYDIYDDQGHYQGTYLSQDAKTRLLAADGNFRFPHTGRVWVFLNKDTGAKTQEAINMILSSLDKQGKMVYMLDRPKKILCLFEMG